MFYTIAYTKSTLKGSVYWKKFANSCIWGPILWAVLTKKESANQPRMDQLKKFQQFPAQNSNNQGIRFVKKNQLMYLGLHILNKWGCLPISPKWTNFDFFLQFPVQNQNSNRIYLRNKLTSIVFRALWDRSFWLRACLPNDRRNMGRSQFFDNFEFKIKNNFRSVQCKKLLGANDGIIGISPLAHGHWPKFFNTFFRP